MMGLYCAYLELFVLVLESSLSKAMARILLGATGTV